MTLTYKKVPTTHQVYRLLLDSHSADVRLFETFSDPDGQYSGGDRGEMVTVWGLKGSDCALFGARTTWDREPLGNFGGWNAYGRTNEKHEYWLCAPQPSPSED